MGYNKHGKWIKPQICLNTESTDVDTTRRYTFNRIFEEDGVYGMPSGNALPS